MRLFNVRTRPVGVRHGSTTAPRPTRGSSRTRSSDEIHKTQRALNGVARSKLTFDSDRDGERMSGTVAEPQHQGDLHLRLRRREPAARHRRQDAEHRATLVARRALDCLHVVPPRRREHLHLEHLSGHARRGHEGRPVGENWLPAVVARRHAHRASARRATATRRSTSSTATARTCAGSRTIPASTSRRPGRRSGTQIAFTSDRTGTPQIYVVGADGLDLREADLRRLLRPADVVAGAVQRDRVLVAHRARAFDIKVIDLVDRRCRAR